VAGFTAFIDGFLDDVFKPHRPNPLLTIFLIIPEAASQMERVEASRHGQLKLRHNHATKCIQYAETAQTSVATRGTGVQPVARDITWHLSTADRHAAAKSKPVPSSLTRTPPFQSSINGLIVALIY
jgi:hypothetical protein